MNTPLPSQFWEELPQKSDIELYEMLAQKDDYLPEAVAAAGDELRRRNLDIPKAAQIQSIVESQILNREKKAHERLSWPTRLLIAVGVAMALGILPFFIVVGYYHMQGYKQKAKDCWITFTCILGALVLVLVAHELLRGLTSR